MTATCTLTDLQWLLDVVRSLPAVTGPRTPPEQAERAARVESWVITAIDVRRAQHGQRETSHHRQLMDAYQAAVEQWKRDRENATNGYPAEQRDYAELHPRPTLKAFMIGHRQQHAATPPLTHCPVCGSLITIDEHGVRAAGEAAA